MSRAAVERLLSALDPEQRQVAEALRGPVRVLAGAGTGKTRAITHRIAHGVHTGVYEPTEVLAVTFTTRAAGEMRGRLRQLGADGVQARTFHSAALRQLRYFWPHVHGSELPALTESKIPLVSGAARRLGLEPRFRQLRLEGGALGPERHALRLQAGLQVDELRLRNPQARSRVQRGELHLRIRQPQDHRVRCDWSPGLQDTLDNPSGSLRRDPEDVL